MTLFHEPGKNLNDLGQTSFGGKCPSSKDLADACKEAQGANPKPSAFTNLSSICARIVYAVGKENFDQSAFIDYAGLLEFWGLVYHASAVRQIARDRLNPDTLRSELALRDAEKPGLTLKRFLYDTSFPVHQLASLIGFDPPPLWLSHFNPFLSLEFNRQATKLRENEVAVNAITPLNFTSLVSLSNPEQLFCAVPLSTQGSFFNYFAQTNIISVHMPNNPDGSTQQITTESGRVLKVRITRLTPAQLAELTPFKSSRDQADMALVSFAQEHTAVGYTITFEGTTFPTGLLLNSSDGFNLPVLASSSNLLYGQKGLTIGAFKLTKAATEAGDRSSIAFVVVDHALANFSLALTKIIDNQYLQFARSERTLSPKLILRADGPPQIRFKARELPQKSWSFPTESSAEAFFKEISATLQGHKFSGSFRVDQQDFMSEITEIAKRDISGTLSIVFGPHKL